MIKHVTTKEYDNEVKEGIVLVDFYADWCGPCKMLAPILETLSKRNPDLKILEVNVDEEKELSSRFNIMAIPTLILYKGGKQVDNRQGFADLDLLEEMIEGIK